jgi:hypothetical protein
MEDGEFFGRCNHRHSISLTQFYGLVLKMQDTSKKLSKRSHIKTWLMVLLHYVWYRGIRVSITAALGLVVWDAVLFGSFILSIMVCPVWFLYSIVKNASNRPGWKLALLRITIPALTLGLVLTNATVQSRIAEANATKIIGACKEFHTANGRYPRTLDELVPKYMPSVPRAKYCLDIGKFLYFEEQPMLMWYDGVRFTSISISEGERKGDKSDY